MTHAVRFVAVVAVLTALALCAPVQAQTPETDALRANAEAGDAEDQYALGVMYDYGIGVPQDEAEAVRWYRLAADQGDAAAQYRLGINYDDGEGVPEDDVEAVRWFRLAAAQGVAAAQTTLGVMYATGEGGMGQVWQATDTKLNRQVALKILPDAFAADPERLARFQRDRSLLH
jgi:TPR repeat protein